VLVVVAVVVALVVLGLPELLLQAAMVEAEQ
jgi:hypothetical protein